MDQVISGLYAIPVVGLLFQLAGYFIDVLPLNAATILQSAVPIALAALCGVMCERSGVVNIGIEGMMLTAAFVGWLAGVVLAPMIPADGSAFFGVTPALLLAFAIAVGAAVLVSLLHAWLSISVKADQIISGTIINIAAGGLTGYLHRLIVTPNPGLGGAIFSDFPLPAGLADVPVLGWLVTTLFKHGPISM